MSKILAGLTAILLPLAAQACPWASNIYTVSGNNATSLLEFNADCTRVKVGSPTDRSKYNEYEMVKIGNRWVTMQRNGWQITFRNNGRSVQIRQGGQNIRFSAKKIN
ncbi:MAG: hypothetical protein AAF943_07590 [Pseudomonadota bacterium]